MKIYHLQDEVSDIKDTLQIVELNIMNNCNRSCSYCPHSMPSYQYVQGYMTLDTVHKIADNLLSYNYTNTVALCGYGEPTIHKNLPEIISILNRTNATIELITNGDLLTKDKIQEFFDNGLDLLNISIYDAETDNLVTNLLNNVDVSKYIIRRRYIDNQLLVDRIAIVNKVNNKTNNPCYLTSYKMMVDINGDILLCCNDWTRDEVFGNLTTESLETIWLKNMNARRMALINGNRQYGACQSCDITGTLVGENSVKMFLQRM